MTEGIPAVDLRIRIDYALLGKVQYLLQQRGALTLDSQFGEAVVLDFRVRAADQATVTAELQEASAGRIEVEEIGTVLVGPDLRPIHR